VTKVEFYLEYLKSRFDMIKSESYYLSYSGGRDSHFLSWFIREYLKDDQIQVVAVNTFMEHAEIQKRMEKYADVILYPKLKPFDVKRLYGSPCFSKNQDEFIDRFQCGVKTDNTMKYVERWGKSKFNLNKIASELTLSGKLHRVSNKCCYYLKHEPLERYEEDSGKKAITGVRASEGATRKAKYKSCFTKKGVFNPLWDLDDELFDEIHQTYSIEIPDIYKTLKRTGCAGCPYGERIGKGKIERIRKELDLLSPNKRKFVERYHRESYKVLGVTGGKKNV